MPKTITVELFTFAELSPAIQARLITEECRALAEDWTAADCALPEIRQWAKDLGCPDPDVQYSGFYSQGDGASISGTFYVPSVLPAYVGPVAEAIADWEPLRGLTVRVTRGSSRYNHEYTIDVDLVEDADGTERFDLEDVAREAIRALSRAAFAFLQECYENDTSEDTARLYLEDDDDPHYLADGRVL